MDLWQRRRWRRLLNLIDKLPHTSHTMNALLNDEEYADMVIAAQERVVGLEAPSGPSLLTWTPEVDTLAVVIDKLSVLIESNKKKPGKVVPYARPKTALARARQAREMQRRQTLHERLTAALIPRA